MGLQKRRKPADNTGASTEASTPVVSNIPIEATQTKSKKKSKAKIAQEVTDIDEETSISDWELEPDHSNKYRTRLRLCGDNTSLPKLPINKRPLVITWSTPISRDNESTWPPKYSVLSDRVTYLVINTIPTRSRYKWYEADFDSNGDFIKTRINKGPAVNIKAASGLILDIVYKGYYILYGDAGAHVNYMSKYGPGIFAQGASKIVKVIDVEGTSTVWALSYYQASHYNLISLSAPEATLLVTFDQECNYV